MTSTKTLNSKEKRAIKQAAAAAAKAEQAALEAKAAADAVVEQAEQTEATKVAAEDHTDRATVLMATDNAEAAQTAPVRTTRSIVRLAYKRKYGALQGCGDDIGTELTAAVTVAVGRQVTCDVAKLNAVGRANGIDVQGLYGHLNVGQQRMNVGNRLRAAFKRGERVVIGSRTWNEDGTAPAAATVRPAKPSQPAAQA